MIVHLKFMGILKEKTPADGQLSLAEGSTITDVLNGLDIPVASVQVFTINGTLERDKARILNDGDELTVLPPVGGG